MSDDDREPKRERRGLPPLAAGESDAAAEKVTSCRIGIARDAAFHFYYADNLRRLEALGVELVPFSPIDDRTLPDVDGLYFGGGYPELFAAALTANEPMRGTRFRGHQFRYSELSPAPGPSIDLVYSVRPRHGSEATREGYRMKNVVASYVHAHWASNPKVAEELARACGRFHEDRGR